MENAVDAYHRRLLRKALNVIYPRKVSSEEVYRITKAEPWSQIIRSRRIRWLDHLLRLPDGVPARQALETFQRKARKL